MKRNQLMIAAATTSVLALQLPALGGGHTWRVNELFSNADGTIMFIELTECCGLDNELGVSNVSSLVAGNTFNFPASLACVNCTANAKILLATTGFAALPGAPTPDHIIADGFFNLTGDTVSYSVWHDLAHTGMPTDGNISLQWDGATSTLATFNTPTNFNGDTGFVSARCNPSDVDGDGQVGVLDFLAILANWGSCADACPQDSDLDGNVGVLDFLDVLANWNSCP